MPTQTQEKSNGRGVMAFTPVDCDINEMPPDAAPGEYTAKINDIKVTKTKKDGYPMLVIEWSLLSTDDDGESAQNSVGATVADFISFMPDKERNGRMGKLQARALCDLLEADRDLLPKKITGVEDFDEFIHEVKGAKANLWVTNRVDKNTGETRVGVAYTAPAGGLSAMASLSDDDDKPAASAKKKVASKSKR
jgi:hypothetical protein